MNRRGVAVTRDLQIRGRATARARADVKRRLRDGELSLMAVLRNPPPELERMRSLELVERLPGMGRGTRVSLLNMRAARRGVNLLAPIAELPVEHRYVLCRLVAQITASR